jgi:hypothetical protein
VQNNYTRGENISGYCAVIYTKNHQPLTNTGKSYVLKKKLKFATGYLMFPFFFIHLKNR